jgi:leader peptidase (prepilin peptidase)/N-methyltransferase
VGSFLNVVADRLPSGQSIISPPSHCPKCQKRIARRDLIPVFSYLLLKGRCRYCETIIAVRSFVVELITGLLFVFLYWHYSVGWELAITICYCCLFIILIITDMEQGILPDKVVYPGMVLAVAFAGFGSLFGFEPSFITEASLRIFKPWILNAVLGGASGFILLLVVVVISRGGMGGGDIKLAGLVGLATGFPLIFVAIFLAIVSGGVVAMILLLLKVRSRKQSIPFGPFLALAAVATLLWGKDLLSWYLLASKLPIT